MRKTFGCMPLAVTMVLLAAGMMWAGTGNSRNPQIPFDVNEVVSKASHASRHGNGPGSELGSGEFMVDTSVAWVGASGDQTYSSVAFDGTNYLVVWQDNRGSAFDIFGARVTQAGALLDTGGIAISIATGDQGGPTVAFDGANYLVVWEDYRSGANSDVYGARVTQAGAVLDTGGIAISVAANSQHFPAVACDGTDYLIAWHDSRSGNNDIYGARVTQAGVVLDTGGIAISTAASAQFEPAAAFDGTDYLVVWQDYRSGPNSDIYGARVTLAGVVLDGGPTVGIAISTAANVQVNPAVAVDDSNCLVVWEDYRSGPNSDIYGARVTQAGVVKDAGGIAISTATDDQSDPALSFDGTNYTVVWHDRRSGSDLDIYGARVSQAGTVLDAGGIAISVAADDQACPAVAFDGANYLVACQSLRSGSSYDIYGARVSQAGTVLDPGGIAVSMSANDQCEPSAAFDGTNYLVAWQDLRSGSSYDIYGARVTQAGLVLDAGGIAISTATDDQTSPALAFDGVNYLVTWTDHRSGSDWDIYGARVSQAGAVLDAGGIAISTAADDQGNSAVTFDGTNYLVAWHDRRSGSDFDIYGARMSQAGAVLDAGGIAISTATGDQSGPTVAFDGTNYLAVWQDRRGGSNSDIYGARVSQAGAVLDAGGIAISVAANSQHFPALAFDGTNYLIAWHDSRSGNNDIYGARVSQAGAVLDAGGIAISTAASAQFEPAVAFDGTKYLVVWQDYGSGASSDVYGARVTTSGGVVDTLLVSYESAYRENPALACGFGGQVLAVYDGWTEFVGISSRWTRRTLSRFVAALDTNWVPEPSPPPGVRNKAISDGGALATMPGNGDTTYSFLLKGNNTCEFYCYNSATGAWNTLDSIPIIGRSSKKKTVKKGSALVAVEGKLYAFKGNNTNEFWCFTPPLTGQSGAASGSWQQYPDVPGDKKCKDGTDAATVVIDGSPYVYLLKGGTNEFYRNSVTAKGAWETLTGAPLPPSGKVYKTGSAIVYYPDDKVGTAASGRLFALKGSYNEFHAYDLLTGVWTDKAALPLTTPPSTKKTKVKAGAGLAYSASPKLILALKGNKTVEFWKYEAAANVWARGKDVPLAPSGKKVGAGGSISCVDRTVYIVKGNKTSDFYSLPVSESDAGGLLPPNGLVKSILGASDCKVQTAELRISPNPFTPSLNPSISYSLPMPGNINLRLYDVTGKLITTLASGYRSAGSYSYSLLTTHHSLAAGIYLLKFETEDYNTTEKLIIE